MGGRHVTRPLRGRKVTALHRRPIGEGVELLTVKRIKVSGQTVRVASIKDLIRMKRASGRPQDLEDVEALGKLR